MSDHDATGEQPLEGTPEWYNQAPKVSDALRKGVAVTITTWGGREVKGLVCDREQVGILLDLRLPGPAEDEEGQPAGYVFLPWSSVEQVEIQEVPHRRVKFLPG